MLVYQRVQPWYYLKLGCDYIRSLSLKPWFRVGKSSSFSHNQIYNSPPRNKALLRDFKGQFTIGGLGPSTSRWSSGDEERLRAEALAGTVDAQRRFVGES